MQCNAIQYNEEKKLSILCSTNGKSTSDLIAVRHRRKKQTNKQTKNNNKKQANKHTHTHTHTHKNNNKISSCVDSEIAQAQIKAVDLSVKVCSGLLKQEFFDQRNSMTRKEVDLVRWKTRSTRTSIGPSPFSSSSSSAFNGCVTVWDLQPLWSGMCCIGRR